MSDLFLSKGSRGLGWVALTMFLLIGVILGQNALQLRPVAADVFPKFTPQGAETLLSMKWQNQRKCRFAELTVMQGSYEFPDQVRSPIALGYGKPVGSRGIGGQSTGETPWRLTRPEILHGPDVIMTAWHICGAVTVPSTMFVEAIGNVFP